ncbi:MAG: hypothetical protein Q8Q62_22320 [Mesorhizobium sp.]|nr:hypothetical protein [Mesorhizobium sp.]
MNVEILFGAFATLLAQRRAIRAALRTERMIGALPRDIRKDIGWPDSWVGPERRR